MKIRNIKTKLQCCPACGSKAGVYAPRASILLNYNGHHESRIDYLDTMHEGRELRCNNPECNQKYEIRGGWLKVKEHRMEDGLLVREGE